MSLGSDLAAEIIDDATDSERLVLYDTERGGAASVEIAEKSPLAVSCRGIWGLPPQPPTDLKLHCERLAQRLNYLSEPLRVLEFDSLAQETLLRSAAPRQTGSGPSYFEVRVDRAGKAELTRYEHPAGEPRAAIPFTLTLETLARVIDDLVA